MNPFDKYLESYWNQRHLLFSKFDEGIRVDQESLYMSTREPLAHEMAQHTKGKVVLDGFGGIGSDAIALAQYATHVYSVEIDKDKISKAKHNAQIYGVRDNITFIHENFFSAIDKYTNVDIVYLDPPWDDRPKRYKQQPIYSIDDFPIDATIMLEKSLRIGSVIFKIPKNFDTDELDQFNRKFTVKDDIIDGKLYHKTIFFE